MATCIVLSLLLTGLLWLARHVQKGGSHSHVHHGPCLHYRPQQPSPGHVYQRCHRHLLWDHLLANGVSVLHILPTGEINPHKLTAGAKVLNGTVTYPGQPTLFDMDAP